MLKQLPDDSYLSAITPTKTKPPKTQAQAQAMADVGKAVIVRVLDYAVTDRPDAPAYRVITSITHWRQMISGDLAAVYHQR